MATYTFTGMVLNQATQRGVAGLRVECWDRDAKINDLLGETITDKVGRFAIAFDDARFSDSGRDIHPDIFLKVFSGDNLIHSTEKNPIMNWNPQHPPVVVEITPPSGTEPEPTIPDVDKEPIYRVSGHVLQSTGQPAERLTVVAFDRGVCDEKALGAAETDKDGAYQIIYAPADFIDPAKPRADLIVHVYQDYPSETEALASSP
jgi:5-hydroxyisourate hydrolase-like protein (transthyretin family)